MATAAEWASASGGRDEAHKHRAPAAGHLVRDNVGLADLVPLVVSQRGDNGELGQDDGSMDGSGYLLGALNTQTDVSTALSNGNKCLEPGLQGSTGLLLHKYNLQNLILEGCAQKRVSDLRFPDGQRDKIDLLQGLDLHVLDLAAQLGDRDPLLNLGFASAPPLPQPGLPWRSLPWPPTAAPHTHPRSLGLPAEPMSSAVWCLLGEEKVYILNTYYLIKPLQCCAISTNIIPILQMEKLTFS